MSAKVYRWQGQPPILINKPNLPCVNSPGCWGLCNGEGKVFWNTGDPTVTTVPIKDHSLSENSCWIVTVYSSDGYFQNDNVKKQKFSQTFPVFIVEGSKVKRHLKFISLKCTNLQELHDAIMSTWTESHRIVFQCFAKSWTERIEAIVSLIKCSVSVIWPVVNVSYFKNELIA